MISCQNLLTVSLTLIILNENYNDMGSFSKILLVTDRIDWLLTLIITGLNQYVECSQNLLNTKNYMVQKNWTYMSHFAYACKMRCPLNLVLENSKYLWFYWTFCIVILDCGLKPHKLSNHTLVMLQKWLEIH